MDPDRNLLFAVLALQLDAINAGQFSEACALWAEDKTVSLADVLLTRGWLSAEDRTEVERLLERKLKKHDGDARAGLAEMTVDHLRQTLAGVANPDVRLALSGETRVLGPVTLARLDYQPDSRERYTLTRMHAKGGIGQVWLARDADLGRDVALKQLRAERAHDAGVRARFLDEAKITGQLEHPGIVPVYELARRSDDQQPFYTMRFIRGRTLTEAVKDYHAKRKAGKVEVLELRELLTAFVAVCQAVAYAHSRGVVHRDLKGQNVVLGDFGEVMVLDWGLAKVVAGGSEGGGTPDPSPGEEPPAGLSAEPAGRTLQGQVLGTPAYMAPEQAAGRLDQIDARTDVYGLGAILYEILAGRPPFGGGDTRSVLAQIREKPPLRPRLVVAATPPALEAVCLKALAKQRADRYASAAALAREIQQWLADEPVTAYPEPLAAQARRWVKRHRTLVATAAALLVTAVVGLAVSTVLIAEQRDQKEAARAEAEANAAEAQRQRAEAEAQRRIAEKRQQAAVEQHIKAIDPLLGLVESVHRQIERARDTNRPLAPELLEFRRELIARVTEGVKSAAASVESSQASRFGVVRANLRLGQIFRQFWQAEEALKQYQQGYDLVAKVVAEEPDNLKARGNLAVMAMSVGDVHAELTNNANAAKDYFNQSVRLTQEVLAQADRLDPAKNDPKIPDLKRNLANAYEKLGWAIHYGGDPAGAMEPFRQAFALRKEMFGGDPRNPNYRQTLASFEGTLGEMCHHCRDLAAAREHFEKSLAVQDELVRQQAEYVQAHPNNPQGQQALTGARIGLAGIFALYGDYDLYLKHYAEAEKLYGDTLEIHEQVSAADPRNRDVLRVLSTTHLRHGAALLRQRGPAAAAPDYQASLEIQKRLLEYEPENLQRQADYMRALARSGQHAAAAALAAKVRPRAEQSPLTLIKVAGCYSKCAAVVAPDEQKLRQEYASRALEAFSRAVALGYRDLVEIEVDPDFDTLLELEGYKQLTEGLRGP
jgi:serine/threonine protein kinase/tetratricopeptide (TPR) repeat protein